MKRCLCVLMLLALLPLAACGQAKPAALPSAATTTTPTATTTTAAATTTTQTTTTTTAATALRDGMKNDGTPMGYVGTEVYADSLKTAPDIVVIMLGTNDAKPVNWDGIADNPRRFIADTAALVRTYQQLGSAPTVFLALPPTVHKPYSTITEEALVQKVIPALRQAAEDTGALLIDTHTATKDAEEHFKDGVHPSDDVGRKRIADAVAAAITAYVDAQETEEESI